MDKRTNLSNALKTAMLEKDKIKASTIRLVLAALKERDIDEREKGKSDGLSDQDILLLIQSMVKQRQDSSKIYSEAGRDDLAEQEELEIDILRGFMPAQLSDEKLEDVIATIISDEAIESMRDMGRVMGILKKDYTGQVDMSKASTFVKKALS